MTAKVLKVSKSDRHYRACRGILLFAVRHMVGSMKPGLPSVAECPPAC